MGGVSPDLTLSGSDHVRLGTRSQSLSLVKAREPKFQIDSNRFQIELEAFNESSSNSLTSSSFFYSSILDPGDGRPQYLTAPAERLAEGSGERERSAPQRVCLLLVWHLPTATNHPSLLVGFGWCKPALVQNESRYELAINHQRVVTI
uniref:Uncharacterized protein n=1 Tax=Arundo donax TaxID=35708 RepID=A0A0A9DAG2_ARUDO